MEHIDYFKLQAKHLLKDYKSRFFDEEQNSYAYNPKYFKIAEIFSDFGLPDEKEDFDFCLMNAQHIIAKLSGFSKWNELKDSDADELRSAHRQFDKSVYKINVEKKLPAPKNLYAFIVPKSVFGVSVSFSFDSVEYAKSYMIYSSKTNDIMQAKPLAEGPCSPINHMYRGRRYPEKFFWVRAFDGVSYGEWSEVADCNR